MRINDDSRTHFKNANGKNAGQCGWCVHSMIYIEDGMNRMWCKKHNYDLTWNREHPECKDWRDA